MSSYAFDWWPGLLAWLLVFEVLILGVFACSRILAKLLGRHDPHDFFVVFYRVFWQAFRKPDRFFVPHAYTPWKRTSDAPAAPERGEALEEADLDALFREDDDATPASRGHVRPASAGAAAGRGGDAATGGEVSITIRGEAASDRVEAVEGRMVTIATHVRDDSGQANAVAHKQLTLLLGLPAYRIALAAGHTRAEKMFRVSGLTQDELDTLLERAAAGVASARDDDWGVEAVAFRD